MMTYFQLQFAVGDPPQRLQSIEGIQRLQLGGSDEVIDGLFRLTDSLQIVTQLDAKSRCVGRLRVGCIAE